MDGDSYSEVSAGASVIAEVRAAGSCSSGGSRQCLSDHKLSIKPEKHPEPGEWSAELLNTPVKQSRE